MDPDKLFASAKAELPKAPRVQEYLKALAQDFMNDHVSALQLAEAVAILTDVI